MHSHGPGCLHCPVDQHAAFPAFIAGMPFGEDVLVEGGEVGGVGGDRGGSLTPQPRLPGRERGVGDRAGRLAAGLYGEEPAACVAQVVLGVAVLACRHGGDPGVGPVGVDQQQQQPLEEHGRVDVAAGAGRGEGVQAAGPQRGLGQHVQQRHGAPAGLDRGLEPPQVPRLGGRLQRGQDDRPAVLALLDLQPVQGGQRLVERGQLGFHLLAQLADERGGIQGLAQRLVVLGPVGFKVLLQVVVGIAPPAGAGHPDLLAPQLLPQCLEHPHSYTDRRIRGRPRLSVLYSSSRRSGGTTPSRGTCSPRA